MNIFLEHLKEELLSQDLTQKELAEKTNISVNTIRGWFSKDLIPDVFTAVKIAKTLNTSVEFLVTGNAPTFPKDESKEKAVELAQEIIKTLK